MVTTADVFANAKMVPDVYDRVRNEINLDSVAFKLHYPNHGEGVPLEALPLMIERYRQFFTLMIVYPDYHIPPTAMMDRVWHRHILDTKAYFDDCDRVAGYYIHHYPYCGDRGEQDEIEHQEAFESNTIELFKIHFGVDLMLEIGENSPNCYKCGSNCTHCGGCGGGGSIREKYPHPRLEV